MLLELLASLLLAGMMPWLFLFPSCLCCGTPCGTAGACSTTPASATVTFTGYTNNGCSSCANYNATWIVNRNTAIPFPSNCFYLKIETGSPSPKGCASNPDADSVSVDFSVSGSDTILGIGYSINGPAGGPRNLQFWQGSLGTAPVACGGLGTFMLPFNTSFIADACSHDSSDVEVTI